jgi:hypothetical protein
MSVRQTFVKLCACYGEGTVVASNPSDHAREGEVDEENVVPALLQINSFCSLLSNCSYLFFNCYSAATKVMKGFRFYKKILLFAWSLRQT